MVNIEWLDNIEQRCFPGGEVERLLSPGPDDLALPPMKAQMRQLIAAVRLAEEFAGYVGVALAMNNKGAALEKQAEFIARLRSGEVEEK